MHTLFSHGADLKDFPAFARALSRLPASRTDFVPPVPVQLSEAVASRLISVEVYNDYTNSERNFVQLATDSCYHVKKESSRKRTGNQTKILMLTFPFICLDLAYSKVWSIAVIPHNST